MKEIKVKGSRTMTILFIIAIIMAMSTPTVKKAKLNQKYWFSKKLDDTDNFTTGARSNLALYIDHGTGVHYIKSPFGSLTPRLDANGNIVSEYQQHQIKDAP